MIRNILLFILCTGLISGTAQAQQSVEFSDLAPITAENVDGVALLKVWTSEIYPHKLMLSPDNRTLAVFDIAGALVFYDVETEAVRHIADDSPMSSLTPFPLFTNDGRFLIALDDNATLHIWNVETGDELAAIAEQNQFVLNNDTTMMATSGLDPAIHLWDIATGEELAILEGEAADVQEMDFSPDDSTLITVSAEEFTARLWDIASESRTEVLLDSNGGAPRGVFFNNDGSQFAVQYAQGISVWDAETFELVTEFQPGEGSVWAGFYSVNDDTLITIGTHDNFTRVSYGDAQTGQQTFAFDTEHSAQVIQFNDDESLFLMVTTANSTELYDTASGTLQRELYSATSGLSANHFFGYESQVIFGQVGSVITIYGIPQGRFRPLPYILAQGIVRPSAVNLRSAPFYDAEIIGSASRGVTIVGGRDATGEFLYLLDYRGWVIAEDVYITLINNVTMQDLPVLASDVNAQ